MARNVQLVKFRNTFKLCFCMFKALKDEALFLDEVIRMR